MPRRAPAENVIRLTKMAIANATLEPGQTERTLWDAEVAGFGVRLRASGNRSWVIRPPRGGGPRSKLFTIGSVDLIDLMTARQTARLKLAEAALGGDPTKARQEARAKAAITLGSLLPRYLAHKEAMDRRATTIGNMTHHLNVHWAPLRERPLTAITRAEVAERHRQIADKAVHGPQAADRALSILCTFFGWCMREGLLGSNPAENQNKAAASKPRERVLSDDELATVWMTCRDDDYGRIVRLLILTGLRRNEVAGIRWTEVDHQAALWSIPPERMKNRRSHEVPLSRPVLQILSETPAHEGRDLIFGAGEGPFSGFSKAKKSLDKRSGNIVVNWTQHDLRRTMTTRMNEMGILPHIADACLSHISTFKSGVAGTYNWAQYRTLKRDALDQWAAYVVSITTSNK